MLSSIILVLIATCGCLPSIKKASVKEVNNTEALRTKACRIPVCLCEPVICIQRLHLTPRQGWAQAKARVQPRTGPKPRLSRSPALVHAGPGPKLRLILRPAPCPGQLSREAWQLLWLQLHLPVPTKRTRVPILLLVRHWYVIFTSSVVFLESAVWPAPGPHNAAPARPMMEAAPHRMHS